MTDLGIREWSEFLKQVADSPDQIIGKREGKICLLDRNNLPKGFQRLSIEQITAKTLELFEQTEQIDDSERQDIMQGLDRLVERRQDKYDNLHPIRKFFAGESTKCRIARDVANMHYVSALFQTGHTCTHRLFRDFEQEIPANLGPEVIEATVATLLKDPKIAEVKEYHLTLHTMCEAAASRYLDKDDFASACRVRKLARMHCKPPKLDFLTPNDIHIGSLDTSDLKNSTIHIENIFLDAEPLTRITFTLNRHKRAELEKTLQALKRSPHQKLLEETVTISQGDDNYCKRENEEFSAKKSYTAGTADSIQFGEKGRVKVGNDPGYLNQHNRVEIQLPFLASEDDLSLMLSTLGLGAILFSQRESDDERVKVLTLFRHFFPKEARSFETAPDTFSMSVARLKNAIIRHVPSMREILQKYLIDEPGLLYKQEIYPGKEVWAIRGAADEIRRAGGIGLMSGLRGNPKEAFATAAKILEHGSLSSQDRFEKGWFQEGVSSKYNLFNGSGNQVFTRMVTQKTVKAKCTITSHLWHGSVQVLYDLEVLERGGYAYTTPAMGSKRSFSYLQRTLSSITEEIQRSTNAGRNNEFMVKNRIPPQYIAGLVVQSEAHKVQLIETLRKEGRLRNQDGIEVVIGFDKPVEEFVHVSNTFSMEMWGVEEKDLPIPPETTEIVQPQVLEGFPAALEDVYVVSRSWTGAKLVGQEEAIWVAKTDASPQRSLNEYYANKAYKALGIRVPEVKLYWSVSQKALTQGERVSQEQVTMLVQPIDGKPVQDYVARHKIDDNMILYRKLHDNFVADCLLGNWDATRRAPNAIFVDTEGNPWRTNNSSAFNYRETLHSEIPELETLRSSVIGYTTVTIANERIIQQINDILSKQEALLEAIPDRLKEVMQKRLEYLITYRDKLEAEKEGVNAAQREILGNPEESVTFTKEFSAAELTLNNVPLQTTPARDWGRIPDVEINEPPYQGKAMRARAAGTIIEESDGRLWLLEPQDHYGGYQHTFPKGRQEPGLSLQQTAIKEAWEESGLHVEITGFFCDQSDSVTHTRYYRARRIGGDPADAHWEAATVKLVPKKEAEKLLNVSYDRKLLRRLNEAD